MRSVPARLGVEEKKKEKRASIPPGKKSEGLTKSLTISSRTSVQQQRLKVDKKPRPRTKSKPANRRKTYASFQLHTPNFGTQSTRSLGDKKDAEKQGLSRSMVYVPVISI